MTQADSTQLIGLRIEGQILTNRKVNLVYELTFLNEIAKFCLSSFLTVGFTSIHAYN